MKMPNNLTAEERELWWTTNATEPTRSVDEKRQLILAVSRERARADEAEAGLELLAHRSQEWSDRTEDPQRHPFVEDENHPDQCRHSIWRSNRLYNCCGYSRASHAMGGSN